MEMFTREDDSHLDRSVRPKTEVREAANWDFAKVVG